MPDCRLTADTPSSTSRDGAKRLGGAGVALLALGAPFVVAAPAVAHDGGPGQAGNSHAEAQPGADASVGAGGQGGAASTAAAPQSGHSAGPRSGATATEGSGNAEASAGNGSAVAHSGGNTAHPNTATAGAHGHAETSHPGTAASAAAGGHVEVDGGAAARGSHEAPAHTRGGGSDNTRARTRDESREAARGHGAAEAESEQDLHVEGNVRARGNGRLGDSAQARGDAVDRRGDRGRVARHGDRGLTDVRVTPSPEGRAGRQVSAFVKASPALEAAIRAEAREAARAEIRARFPRPEAGQAGAKRFAVKRRFEGAGHRVRLRRPTTAEQAAALVRILETTWNTCGPARTNALLELCLGRRPSNLPVLLRALRKHALAEAQERPEGMAGGNGLGNAEARETNEIFGALRGRGIGTAQLAPGRSEETNNALTAGTPAPMVEAPSAPVTASPMPGSAVLPGTEGIIHAPRGAGAPPLPRGSANRPGATTGPSAPTGVRVRREAGAAVQQRQLPFTGVELPLIIIAGAAALAAGALLRRGTNGVAR